MKRKLAVDDYTDGLQDLHEEALMAMDQEIEERKQGVLKLEDMNRIYEASYVRYDKKRKFLEQDVPSKLEKAKEVFQDLKSDFAKYIAQHEKEQQQIAEDDLGEDYGADADDDEDDYDGPASRNREVERTKRGETHTLRTADLPRDEKNRAKLRRFNTLCDDRRP